MKHSFRAQDTPNADAELTHLNEHFGAHSVAEGMAAFRSRLPESFRKDAVQAVEYLITASRAMQSKPKSEQDALLQGLARVAEAASWGGKRGLRRHPPGRDDTTHVRLCGAARPETGRLNAKRWLGGAKALRDMQTDFAQQVGQQHGLERGLEGSKSRHTTIQAYYGRVERGSQQTPRVDVPEPSMGDRVNVRAYGEKVATSVVGQLRPKWQEAVGQGQRAGGGQEGRTRGKGGRGRPEQAAAADCGCAAPSERGGQEGFGLDRGRCVAQDSGRPGGEDSPARPGTPGSQVKPRPGQRLQPVSLEQRTYGLLSQPSGSG